MTSLRQPPYLPDEERALLDYLTSLYRNVFTEEAIRAHLVNHVAIRSRNTGSAW